MKNYEANKIIKSFLLFLATCFLAIAIPFISNAQSGATAPSLAGTTWRVTSINQAPLTVNYWFDGQGGVTAIIDTDPLSIAVADIPRVQTIVKGRYRQTGKYVHIEFPDRIIDARIDGNNLIGEDKEKASGRKATWTAEGGFPYQSKRATQASDTSDAASSSFSVSSSHALIGVWKHTEYAGVIDAGSYKGPPPSVTGIITYTFNQSGVVLKTKTAVYGNIGYTEDIGKLNWKYVPQTDSTGVLEQYEGDKLVYKNNIRWINNNQFEVSSSGDGRGLIFQHEGNNPNRYKSLNESVNVPPPNPSSLSMKERLPAQLGQFKLIFFSDNCITPVEKEEAEAQAKGGVPQVGDPTRRLSFSQWIEKPCSKGEIEIASASYGDTANCNWLFCIRVSIEKYEDSGKATQAMAHEITKLSDLWVIKREPFKNNSRQPVGELVLLRSPKVEIEKVMFTFGTYFYSISSAPRGNAQNALKFLPLEIAGIPGRTGHLKGR